MRTASKNLWTRLTDVVRRRAFARTHVSNFLAMQIFKMRKDRGLSQSDLAEMIGSSQPQISEWEGSCETISLRTLHRLADAFDVAVSVKFVPYSDLVREALVSPSDSSVLPFSQESYHAVGYRFLRQSSADDFARRSKGDWGPIRSSSYLREKTTRPLTGQNLYVPKEINGQ